MVETVFCRKGIGEATAVSTEIFQAQSECRMPDFLRAGPVPCEEPVE
jgi:hypothetical protein